LMVALPSPKLPKKSRVDAPPLGTEVHENIL
jgi:hypothetical protein